MQKKWYWALGIFVVIIAILILLSSTGERSVSNFYFIPAGTFSPFHEMTDTKGVALHDPNKMSKTLNANNNSDYLSSFEIYSFGEPVNLQEHGLKSSNELYSRLRKVADDSESEIDKYYYPNGSVIGFGYDMFGNIDVQIYKERPINQTEADKIYEIIEKHGEQNGMQKVPVKFYSMDMIKLD